MNCNVIKDLMPLYIEKLTSDSSNSLIEEHIKSCEDCRKMINKLQADIINDNKEVLFDKVDNLGNNIIKRIKRNITEKILMAVLITLILGIFLGVLGTKAFMFIAFLGTISVIAFTGAILISIPIANRKLSLRKRFKSLGYYVFIFSIVITLLSFVIFKWYFNSSGKMYIIIILEVLYNVILTLTLRIYARFELPKEDIVDAESPLNKRLFKVTFITLISIIVIISAPVTLLEKNRIVDNINLPFVNDSDVLGKWTTVDFVRSQEQFAPDKHYYRDDLFLKGFSFFENGKIKVSLDNNETINADIPSSWLLWTKDYVMNSGGDHTTSKYIIREIDGTKYMFFEWKSGDYVYFHKNPGYYVLKKVSKN